MRRWAVPVRSIRARPPAPAFGGTGVVGDGVKVRSRVRRPGPFVVVIIAVVARAEFFPSPPSSLLEHTPDSAERIGDPLVSRPMFLFFSGQEISKGFISRRKYGELYGWMKEGRKEGKDYFRRRCSHHLPHVFFSIGSLTNGNYGRACVSRVLLLAFFRVSFA